MSVVLMQDQSPDRSKYLGSSDVAALFGVSKWKTALDVYLAKTDPTDEQFDPDRARILRRGHTLEPYIVQMMCEQLERDGHDVELVASGQRFRHRDHPFIAAEIDCELRVDGELCNGEAKSAGFRAADEWGEAGTDEIPIHYSAQVHLAQAVMQRRTTWVGALFGLDDCVMYKVDADDELQDALIDRMVRFWHDNVLAGVAPNPETMKDIHNLYRKSGPPPIEATHEILRYAESLRTIRQSIKSMEDQAVDLQFRIAAFMAESDTLLVNGEPILTFKHQERTTLDTKRLRAEKPDVFVEFARRSESRPMTFKRKKK